MVSPLAKVRSRLRLRHLQLLAALDGRKSLVVAAEELGMTQPAASKSLKELEELLELQLFSRDGRRVAINPHGEAVTRYARMVFDRLGELREELASIERADLGRVRLGAVSATTAELLGRLIVSLKESHPRLNLLIQVDTSDMLMQALHDEKIDLVVGMIPSGWEPQQLLFEPLAEEGLSVVVRPEHPALHIPNISLDRLSGFSWILHPYTSPMRQLVDDAFLRVRATVPDNVVETTSMLTTVSAVIRSDFVSIMSTPVARFFADRGIVHILPVDVQRRWAPYGVIMHRDKRLTPALIIVMDALRATSQALPDAGGHGGKLLEPVIGGA